MSVKFQKIGNRSLVGIGVVAAVGLSIELGPWAVFGLFGLVAAVGLYEVCALFERGGHAVKPWAVYGMGYALYAGCGMIWLEVMEAYVSVMAAMAGLSGVAVGWVQVRRQGRTRPDAASALSAAGLLWSLWAAVYVALPLALLVWLRRADLMWPLFLTVWANDVFAYLAGSSFKAEKRHKLAPHISPNKSWEGAVGGFCAALAAGWLWALGNGLPAAGMLAFAAVVSGVSVLGDLLESYYKRRAGLKDSGTLLGGHGGVLDRFDSVLLASPAAVLLLILSGI